MEQKTPEELHREMEAEIAANEAADREYRRKLIRNLIIIGVIFAAGISGYLIFRPHNEPDVYYTNGDIDYVKQADKLRRTSGFKSVDEFRGGYAVVSDGKKYGIVDVKGNVICPVKYDAIESNYSQHYPDLCEVNLNGKLGLVDKQGKEVVKPIYDEIGAISSGTMQVTLGKEKFYIDTNGNRME
ncbi:MAG: WG repeat-containing protein [Prevotella sp.]|nr:WG repeat-containing protein [Prevotella sp.]